MRFGLLGAIATSIFPTGDFGRPALLRCQVMPLSCDTKIPLPDPPLNIATASLKVDYSGGVDEGETVIATTDVQRIGRRVSFANCYLHVGDRRVVHASAVLASVDSRAQSEDD